MSITRRGDTLIEVMFAFAILSAIIAVSFSGAMNSYKASLSAQNETQASFVAQYQADALKAYRDSLEWNYAEAPSFLTGYSTSSPPLPAMGSYITTTPPTPFCMQYQPSGASWKVIKADLPAADCNLLVQTLAPQLGSSATLAITLTGDATNGVYASIKVTWRPRNSLIDQNVTNTILLTKDR